MRAFKQFLSLVLVTCMLTSMFAIVSAAGPTGQKTWDSDSGHITIGSTVDSAYNRVKDSGTVQVDLSDDADKVSIDLTSKEDVDVTITGANLDGNYVLKVYDSGNPANMMYESEATTAEKNNTLHQDVDEMDTMQVTFSVPAVIMAGGSTLQVYSDGIDTPAWIISYEVTVQETTEDTIQVPPIVDEEKNSVTIPTAALEVALEHLDGGDYNKVYVMVTLPDFEETPTPDVYLDTSIFSNPKFQAGYTLGIAVAGGLNSDLSYTWTFKAKEETQQLFSINAITEENNGQINLSATYEETTFGSSIPGLLVKVADPSGIPNDVLARLTVDTKVDEYANVFYKDGEPWVLGEKKLQVDKGEAGGETYKYMTIQIFPEATEYAIVDYMVTETEMNATSGGGTNPSASEYTVTVNPESLALSKDQPTDSIDIVVKDAESKVLDSGKYTVNWTSSSDAVTVAANNNYQEEGYQAKVTANANTDNAQITATITLKEEANGTFADNKLSTDVTVKVTASGFTTSEPGGGTGGGTGGSSSSGGGGGSWNDGSHGSSMPSAGSGTTTTPGTGTTTPGTGTSGNAQPQGCVSDTVGNFSVKGSYQYKLTSTNGQAPAVTVSNSNFRVVLASQNGKDYFFKVYAIGAVGQTCDVLVNGTKVSTVTASEVYGGVSCDTTAPFTVKKGGSYQFKLTASSKPVMAAGSSSFRVEYVGNSGNDWFFKVYAVGNAGDGCGFYVNGAPFTVAVAHIGE